jgi:Cyclic nucleotide-binding domain
MPMVDLEAVFERLSAFPILVFEQGDMVLAEGSATGRLLFLIQGAVDVVKDQWQIARVVEPGAVFGDMAALRGQPHSANVIAVQPSSFFRHRPCRDLPQDRAPDRALRGGDPVWPAGCRQPPPDRCPAPAHREWSAGHHVQRRARPHRQRPARPRLTPASHDRGQGRRRCRCAPWAFRVHSYYLESRL